MFPRGNGAIILVSAVAGKDQDKMQLNSTQANDLNKALANAEWFTLMGIRLIVAEKDGSYSECLPYQAAGRRVVAKISFDSFRATMVTFRCPTAEERETIVKWMVK